MENNTANCPQPDRSGYTEIREGVTRRQMMKFAAIGLATFGFTAQSQAVFAVSKRVRVGKTSVIPVRGGKGFTLNGQYIFITQPKKGVFRAFSGSCTHQGVKMASVSGTAIVCSAHGSKFSTGTGKVTNGPATSGLKKYKVSVSKGVLYVTV